MKGAQAQVSDPFPKTESWQRRTPALWSSDQTRQGRAWCCQSPQGVGPSEPPAYVKGSGPGDLGTVVSFVQIFIVTCPPLKSDSCKLRVLQW